MGKSKTFIWQAINAEGQRVQGNLIAKNKKTAKKLLMQRSLIVIKLRQHIQLSMLASSNVPSKQITDFILQLANLLRAGIPLNKSLTIIIDASKNKIYKKLLLEIQNHIETGHSLSTALNENTKYFDPTLISLVQAGEQSGQLEKCLSIITQFRLKQAEFKEKFLKVLIYPLTVIITAIIITMGLIFFAIPQLQNIFTDFGLQLPYLTKLIINFSNIIRQQALMIGFSILSFLTAFILAYRYSRSLQHIFSALLFKIPVLGNLLLQKYIILWSRVMTTTLTAGLALLPSLQEAHRGLKNPYLMAKWQLMQHCIIQGQALHEAMTQIKIFPQRIKSMICTAEQTGDLPLMLNIISELEMQSLDRKIDRLSKLLEPVIMLVLAVIAGTMVFAFYLPILQIGKTL